VLDMREVCLLAGEVVYRPMHRLSTYLVGSARRRLPGRLTSPPSVAASSANT
jgi:hypothetical protein